MDVWDEVNCCPNGSSGLSFEMEEIRLQ
jgi:hypothetical protein